MPATRATSVQQRQEMVHVAGQGNSYQAVADQTGVSFGRPGNGFVEGDRTG